MAIFSGPEIPNNGLVFHYDMSNTVKSWRGAPVVNLAPYTDYSNRNYNTAYDIGGWGGDDADVFYYNSGGYNNLPYKKMVKHTGGTGGSYINEHGYFTLTEGVTYNISCYMRANVATTVSGHTLALNRDSDNAYRVPADIALTTDWVKQTWIYTCAVGEGGATYHFRQIVYNDTQLPLEVYWCGLQISEGTISYPYVNGTRSNTQAILDLTGNNIITASGLAYSSNNTFSFPGNNSLSIPAIDFSQAQTVEIWLQPLENDATRRNPYNQAYGGYGSWTHEPSGNINYYYGDAGSNNTPYVGHTSGFTVVQNEIAHVVSTRNTTASYWYKNGVLDSTFSHGYGTLTTDTNPILIGTGYSASYIGNIFSVKLYNRALSAAEVQQNFEATRGRYGI